MGIPCRARPLLRRDHRAPWCDAAGEEEEEEDEDPPLEEVMQSAEDEGDIEAQKSLEQQELERAL
eukprot:11079991-Alexandrium_andersonii.AAC.1